MSQKRPVAVLCVWRTGVTATSSVAASAVARRSSSCYVGFGPSRYAVMGKQISRTHSTYAVRGSAPSAELRPQSPHWSSARPHIDTRLTSSPRSASGVRAQSTGGYSLYTEISRAPGHSSSARLCNTDKHRKRAQRDRERERESCDTQRETIARTRPAGMELRRRSGHSYYPATRIRPQRLSLAAPPSAGVGRCIVRRSTCSRSRPAQRSRPGQLSNAGSLYLACQILIFLSSAPE